ncbi:MAG: menaquinone biosynthesis protein [Blastocatellia bacterium]|nr:menaquinone biosynthesis protein [Blastocatellia bacterium]
MTEATPSSLPRIAASNYLNSALLIYSFQQGHQQTRCQLFPDAAPARCAEMLRSGRVDAALIPAIEYQRIPDLRVVPGVAVASRHRVRSVVLASRVPIDEVSSVALDTSSRTSVSLIRILFREFYEKNPTFSAAAPNIPEMLASNDAAVIIGDPAMTFDRTRLYVYDLAEEWRSFTSLPFVFAVWAVDASALPKLAGVDFAAARDEGLSRRKELARTYSQQLGLCEDDLVQYLTENICYELDEENLAGLRRYYELAAKWGLIERAEPLRFL